MSFFIKQASPEDAKNIAAIGWHSFTDTFGNLFIDRENLRNHLHKHFTAKAIAKTIADGQNRYYLCRQTKAAAGFAKMKLGSTNPLVLGNRQLELERIYFSPEFQGVGAAQLLMKELLKEAVQLHAEVLWLRVYWKNEKAIRFYEKNGFVKEGTQNLFIGSQEFVFYVMSNALSSQ
jgi:ribosomal protein S18 acetylase RimI-like enzyme